MFRRRSISVDFLETRFLELFERIIADGDFESQKY